MQRCDLIARLEQQQRELEHQHQIEDEKLRALVVELQDELRRRDHTPPPPPDAGCDEVSCVLDNYTGTCCAKFLRQPPEALDRAAISNAMATVRSRVLACGDRSPAKGMVTVHVAVAGNGTVSSVSVESAPSTELGTCVAAAVRQASFAHTQRGGSFSYPFVF